MDAGKVRSVLKEFDGFHEVAEVHVHGVPEHSRRRGREDHDRDSRLRRGVPGGALRMPRQDAGRSANYREPGR